MGFFVFSKRLFLLVVSALILSCSSYDNQLKNIKQGESFLITNDLDSAQFFFNKSFLLDSNNTLVLNHLGDIHFRKVEIGKSLYYFERSIKLDSSQVNIHLKIAEIQLFLGNYKQVFSFINKALRIDDRKPHGYFMKGVAYKLIGDTVKAISSFKTAIEIDYNYYPVYYELGLLLTLKKDPLAIFYYKNGVEVKPKDPGLKGSLAWSYDQFNELDKADNTYFETVRDFPNYFLVKSNYAHFKNKIGDLDSALQLCNEILQEDSSNYEILNLKGIILQKEGRLEEAESVKVMLDKLP